MSERRGLDVGGAVRLSAGSGPSCTVSGRGRTLRVDVGSLRDALRLLRALPRRRSRSGGVRALGAALSRAGLVLEGFVAERKVLRLGAGARPSLFARWFGLGGADLRVAPLLLPARPRRRRG